MTCAADTCLLTLTEPTLWAITGAGFVDSINPCAIAVLLILLAGLLTLKNKHQAIVSGFAFILALYLAYYLVGIGLLGTIQLTGLAPILHKIVAAIAILVGLANIKDYFWYGGMGFVTEVPRSWRPAMKGMLQKIVSPLGAFVVGLVVTFFELPCTGGPYLFVLGLLSEGFSWPVILAILAYYNLIFVLPLIVILALVYLGYTTVDRTADWKNKNIRLLHLVAGIIMVALGVWLVFV